MNCPLCGSASTKRQGKIWCPICKIFLADEEKEFSYPSMVREEAHLVTETPIWFQLFRFLVKISIILSLIALIIFGLGYTFFHQGSLGYREELMNNYGFTQKAKWKLRLTSWFYVAELSNKDLPKIYTHSQYNPRSRTVFVGSANDELAIHEIGHLWWIDLKEDNGALKEQLVYDMIRLSEMEDQEYWYMSKFAKSMLAVWCHCPDKNNINFERVDDGHLFTLTAAFTMGQFKDGSRKLPPFMWKYLEDFFTGKLKITPCYEINSCVHIEFDPNKVKY